MKKVFTLAPKEDWIIDRFVKEWNEDNKDISVNSPEHADVIWLMADFCWRRVPENLLKSKKVIVTIHHIVPEKFDARESDNFKERDYYTDVYIVPNEHTKCWIKNLTLKPIEIIPYWANNKIWKITGEKTEFRRKFRLPEDGFLVGSFQRDTEGSSISVGSFLPKLEKGPDLLAEYLHTIKVKRKELHVVLAGWRRQYIIERLKALQISFSYFELPSQKILNELYQTLDLYPIPSRYEGGPQSLLECGLLNIPVVSRDVGMARQVLPQRAISDDLISAKPAIPDVEAHKLPAGYEAFRNLIASM